MSNAENLSCISKLPRQIFKSDARTRNILSSLLTQYGTTSFANGDHSALLSCIDFLNELNTSDSKMPPSLFSMMWSCVRNMPLFISIGKEKVIRKGPRIAIQHVHLQNATSLPTPHCRAPARSLKLRIHKVSDLRKQRYAVLSLLASASKTEIVSA